MAASDYASLKVPDLKKLLSERGLAQSGNKADLIARLQENDKASEKAPEPEGTPAEDVIDWDDTVKEDEPKPAATKKGKAESGKPTKATAAAKAEPKKEEKKPKAEPTPVTVPAPVEESPEESTEAATTAVAAAAEEKPAETADKAEEKTEETEAAPATNFALGLEASNADEELKKREARAKRFGITTEPESEEAKRLARAKKFGVDSTAVVKGLDSALPERRPKRARDRNDEGGGGGKRATPDRRDRGGHGGRGRRPRGGRGSSRGGAPRGGVLDDPAEKAKADARAKRFAASA